MKKRAVTLLASLVLVTGIGESAHAANGYQDVPEGYRFAPSIDYVVRAGLADDGKAFRPTVAATRAEVAEFLVRTVAPKQAPRPTTFRDVPATHPQAGAIQYATERGLVSGYTDGNFRPNEPVTRGELAILFYKRFPFLKDEFLLREQKYVRFKDVSPAMKAHDAIQQMARYRVTSGYYGGTYRPNEPIERGQLAAFLERAMAMEARYDVMRDLIRRGGFKHSYGSNYYLVNANAHLEGKSRNTSGDMLYVLEYLDASTNTYRLIGEYAYDPLTKRFYSNKAWETSGKKVYYAF